jgi:tRNA(Glu) U13 pseudouridine synthase TruD
VLPEDLAIAEEDGTLVVSMFLPSGSYATEVVRELTRAPFFPRDAGKMPV